MSMLNATLADRIFLSDFELYKPDETEITFIHSKLLGSGEITRLPPHMAFPSRIFKNLSFYFMVEPSDHKKYFESLPQIALSFTERIKDFITDTTLKKGFPQVGKEKLLDFQTMKDLDSPTAYIIKARYRKGSMEFDFSFFIPRPSLDFLLGLLVHKDISKTSDLNLLSDFIVDLQGEFYRKNIRFPLDIIDFVNSLTDREFQKMLGLMLSNSLMSYDMLWALSTKIKEGHKRVMANLSKTQRSDFIEATGQQDKDSQWLEIALYQTGLNLEVLTQDKKMESLQLDRLNRILSEVKIMNHKVFFNDRPLFQWIEKASEANLLQDLLSQCHDLTLAKAFIALENGAFELIKKNVSKRKLDYLVEDIEYQKKNCSREDQYIAQYDVVQEWIRLKYKTLTLDEKALERWIPRFEGVNDFNFAVQYVGPIDFSLALLPMSASIKRLAVKNLKPPLKYFLSYFLSHKIKFSFPYGETRIKEANEEVIQSFYQLEQEAKIKLKPFAEKG